MSIQKGSKTNVLGFYLLLIDGKGLSQSERCQMEKLKTLQKVTKQTFKQKAEIKVFPQSLRMLRYHMRHGKRMIQKVVLSR